MAATDKAPKGKRTVRRSIYGNLNGYVGREFWCCFGDAFDTHTQEQAALWVAGKIDN